ncbi:PaaI family thioesterase [Planctomycetota bacterium]
MLDTPLSETKPCDENKQRIQSLYHPHCVVCSPTNPRGMHLDLNVDQEGTLAGCFQLDRSAEGYPGLSHGGVVAAVLDGAMGNWLFAHDIVAVTIELNVKYRHPLRLEQEAWVEARLKEDMDPVYVLAATIRQDGCIVACGIGRFIHKPDITDLQEASQ